MSRFFWNSSGSRKTAPVPCERDRSCFFASLHGACQERGDLRSRAGGGGILPVIQGVVADMAGFMASYWVIIAALAYLLFYGLIGCKNVNKDIKVD